MWLKIAVRENSTVGAGTSAPSSCSGSKDIVGGRLTKVVESGIFCVKRRVGGVEAIVVSMWIVEECARGGKGRMVC